MGLGLNRDFPLSAPVRLFGCWRRICGHFCPASNRRARPCAAQSGQNCRTTASTSPPNPNGQSRLKMLPIGACGLLMMTPLAHAQGRGVISTKDNCGNGRIEMIVGGMGQANQVLCIGFAPKQTRDSAPSFRSENTKISARTQQARDLDRVFVLRQELDQEERHLAALKSNPKSDDGAVSRSESNVRALRHELALSK